MSNKTKIGIFLPNKLIDKVVLTNPHKGNPGIGGTQFLMFALPFYMDIYYKGHYEFVFFVENLKSIDCIYDSVLSKDLSDAAFKAKKKDCNIFIFRPNYDQETINLLSTIIELRLNTIAWMHNTPVLLLNHLLKNEFLKNCICVGREQYETLRDHPIINKCLVVYNAIDASTIPEGVYNKNKSVVFLGSLVFAKGFHKLAKIWKKILIQHPDAKLYVIGSGKLYDNKIKLGKINIADEKYERMFIKSITDSNGKVDNSIEFLGILGNEKFKIIKEAMVGVPNPTGISETFCLSAAEIQLCKTPVVSAAKGGLLDTVKNGKSGFLTNSNKKMIQYICKLLTDYNLTKEFGESGFKFIEQKFNYENHCSSWHNLILDIQSEKANQAIIANKIEGKSIVYKYREKVQILRAKYSIAKIILPSIYILHTIEFIKLRWEKFKAYYL